MNGTNEDHREPLKVICSKAPKRLLLSMHNMIGKLFVFAGPYFSVLAI